MAELQDRLARAREAARHPQILATDVERVLGTRYTADTLQTLKDRFPRVRFLWLMGADNLAQLPHWSRWQQIFHIMPVAIFDRPSYSLSALAAMPGKRFARYRWAERKAGKLAQSKPPAWVFIHMPLNPQSATRIRARAQRGRKPDLSK